MRRARDSPSSRCVPAAGLLLLLSTLCCATPISVDEEQRLGHQFEQQVRSEVKLVHDRVIVGYVAELGERLVRAVGPQPFGYRFYVVDSDRINAFAGPAGHVYVHTETLLKVRNVSEVAGVLAHEVAHVARRHIAANYNRQRSTGLFYQLGVATAAVLGGPGAATAVNLGGGLAAMAYLTSFGREAEREADAFAVQVMPRAGYDPQGLVSFFETLRNEGGASAPAFLSSHPATRERIDAARGLIARQERRPGLRTHDGGRLEIIQSRVRLVTGRRAR